MLAHTRTQHNSHTLLYVCLLKQVFFNLAPCFRSRDLSPHNYGDMVETLVALSGVMGSGHRHLPKAADAVLDQAEDVKGKPGSEGHRHLPQAADAVIDKAAQSKAENNAEKIYSDVMFKKGKLCAFFCRMEGHISDDAVSWSDYILPSGALWSDEEGGWLKICLLLLRLTRFYIRIANIGEQCLL